MKIILLRSMVEVPCYICNVNSIVTYWLYKKCSEFNAEDIFEHGVSLLGADLKHNTVKFKGSRRYTQTELCYTGAK